MDEWRAIEDRVSYIRVVDTARDKAYCIDVNTAKAKGSMVSTPNGKRYGIPWNLYEEVRDTAELLDCIWVAQNPSDEEGLIGLYMDASKELPGMFPRQTEEWLRHNLDSDPQSH